MRTFLMAALLAIVIATGSVNVLGAFQQQADEAFESHSGSVRLPAHGITRNLVGNDWYPAKE